MSTTEIQPEKQMSMEDRPPLLSEEYSRHVLAPVMNTRAMIGLFILVLFFITNVPTAVAGGPAGLTLWIVGGLCFFVPCGLASAQLAVLYPNEGGIYNWTYHLMGRFMHFFVGFVSWLPGPLLIVATGDLLVAYLQSLNQTWLIEPWQQELVLIGVIAFSGLLCLQRTATVQRIVSGAAVFIVCASLLVLVAAAVWLAAKHASATAFTHLPDWNPFTPQNIPLFGVITLGYLGVNLPLNFMGEVTTQNTDERRRVITRHLFLGMVIVLFLYLTVTAAILIVQGQNAANNLFAMVTTVDVTLGKAVGDLEAVLIMVTFVVATAVYNWVFSRYLMVGGFDQMATSAPGRLNRNRAPARAVSIQTLCALVISAFVFLAFPYSGLFHGKPADLATSAYFVIVGTGTLLWAFATIYLFVNVFFLFVRRKEHLLSHRIVPVPLLLTSSTVGLLTGIGAVVDTLFNSYIPPLIPNTVWTLLVGGITAFLIVVAMITGIFVSGESSWEVEEKVRE